ncbi:MAG TPA: peptidylprolyl isomerase [Peptococcaceae bacterium]|nr:peptidylprolyl isomerase [Peptococcaceae bacterium]
MKKITLIAVTIFTILALLTGCAQGEDFAVKVNDQAVPRELYETKLKAIKKYFKTQGVDLDSAEYKTSFESVKNEVLEGLIGTELIHQEVVKNNWDLKDPEVTKQWDELKSQIKDYQAWLEEQAMTENEVLEYIAFTYFVAKDVTVSEQEIKQFFEANYSSYGGQDEQVKARHILVKTEEEALAIIEELKAGKDFAELAKEKSIEPAAKTTGGDLGYFRRGEMVAAFEEAAFSQEVGKISEKPVKTDFGYHIILVEDHKEAIVPDFEKAKEQVAEHTLLYAKNQKVQSYFAKLREEAKIDYAEDLKPNS